MRVKSLEQLKDCNIDVLGHQLLVRPFVVQEQKEEVEKAEARSKIIIPTEFGKKVNGELHTIVTEAGKIHLLEVVKVGNDIVNTPLKEGSIVRIRPRLPEDITDNMLSQIVGHPIGIISTMDVLAVLNMNIVELNKE